MSGSTSTLWFLPLTFRENRWLMWRFLDHAWLYGYRRIFKAVFAVLAPRVWRSVEKPASERASLRPRPCRPRNWVASGLLRKGQELATWCVPALAHWRRTRFFGMSPRGEIAFPMPLNRGNALCTVKCQSRRGSCRRMFVVAAQCIRIRALV